MPHGALVAEPEDALAVADHDSLDLVVARMAEDAADQVLVRDAQKYTARLAENVTEHLTAETDRRRIDDRHHLFDVAGQQRVEQRLIGILQAAQEHVALYIAAKPAKSVEPAHDLVIEFGDMRRQEPMQVERVAFIFGERRALVEDRIVEQLITAQRGFDVWRYRSDSSVPAPNRITIQANGSVQQEFYDSLVTRRGLRRAAMRHRRSQIAPLWPRCRWR